MAGSAGSAAAAADAAAAAAAVPEKPFMRTDVQVGDVYHLKATLGRGSYATVKLGVHQQDKTKWAIKLIDRSALSSADSAALEVECRLLRMLVHPHIVAIREVIQGPARFSMILELCVGGELFDRIVEKDHYTEQEARTVLTALASAIAHCHANGVVHRDLKPENLLYADKECNIIKLADFGLASILTEEVSLHTACGTPGYVAPEIIQASGYGSEVDMWSLGVILYILLCGFPPFYDENQTALFSQIIHGVFDFPSPYWDDVGQSAKDLVKVRAGGVSLRRRRAGSSCRFCRRRPPHFPPSRQPPPSPKRPCSGPKRASG